MTSMETRFLLIAALLAVLGLCIAAASAEAKPCGHGSIRDSYTCHKR